MSSSSHRYGNLPANQLNARILSQSQSSREVIQDFVPLADSLEWDLGQQYLKQRGNKAFISDASPVPYVINNDGTLARHAAEVFVASLVQAEKQPPHPQGQPPHPQPLSPGVPGARGANEPGARGEIFVLELGIGVGLFARYFFDHVRDLSLKLKKDYYQRLTYIAADRSERMLSDVLRHGVLAQHPGRVRVRQADAMQPETLAREIGLPAGQKPFRAVFLNYLLDCLPAAVLKLDDEGAKELHVRTVVARNVKLKDYTDLTAEQLRKRAAAGDAKSKRELLDVYGLFASEYDYRPVGQSRVISSLALAIRA